MSFNQIYDSGATGPAQPFLKLKCHSINSTGAGQLDSVKFGSSYSDNQQVLDVYAYPNADITLSLQQSTNPPVGAMKYRYNKIGRTVIFEGHFDGTVSTSVGGEFVTTSPIAAEIIPASAVYSIASTTSTVLGVTGYGNQISVRIMPTGIVEFYHINYRDGPGAVKTSGIVAADYIVPRFSIAYDLDA